MTSVKRRQIVESLRDKEYRDLFVDEHISAGIAFQISATRGDRGWTQAELGSQAGMHQETISQLEDPDYGKFTLRTLKRLAAAFDVALVVRLVPFSELVDWIDRLSPENLAVPSFDNDRRLEGPSLEVLPPASTGTSLTLEEVRTPVVVIDNLISFEAYKQAHTFAPLVLAETQMAQRWA